MSAKHTAAIQNAAKIVLAEHVAYATASAATREWERLKGLVKPAIIAVSLSDPKERGFSAAEADVDRRVALLRERAP